MIYSGNFYLFYFTIELLICFINGQCGYGTNLTDTTDNWFQYYTDIDLGTYATVQYLENGDQQVVVSSSTTLDMTCNNMRSTDDNLYESVYTIKLGAAIIEHDCSKIYVGTNVHLATDTEVVNADASFDDCATAYGSVYSSKAYLRLPLDNLGASACPWYEGYYNITVTADTPCDGDSTAKIETFDGSVTITCYNASAYETPLELTCIESFPADALNEDGGDIVILHYENPDDSASDQYYCGRVNVNEETRAFEMSIYHGGPTIVECIQDGSMTYETTGIDFLNIDATPYGCGHPHYFHNPKWFIGNVQYSSMRFLLTMDYNDKLTVTYDLYTDAGTQTLTSFGTECEHFWYEPEGPVHYTYIGSTGENVCTEETLIEDQGILFRVEAALDGDFDPETCRAAVHNLPLMRIYLEFPFKDLGNTLPWNDGDYTMTYSYKSTDICAGDPSATMTSQGNFMTLISCQQSGDLKTWVNTRYYMYAGFPATVLQPESTDDESYILLSRGGPLTMDGKSVVVCGRYKVDTDGNIALSMRTNTTSTIWCNTRTDSTHYEDGILDQFVAFKFSPSTSELTIEAAVEMELELKAEEFPMELILEDDEFFNSPIKVSVSNFGSSSQFEETVTHEIASYMKISPYRLRSVDFSSGTSMHFIILPGPTHEPSGIQASIILDHALNTPDMPFLGANGDIFHVESYVTDDWVRVEELQYDNTPRLVHISFRVENVNASMIEQMLQVQVQVHTSTGLRPYGINPHMLEQIAESMDIMCENIQDEYIVHDEIGFTILNWAMDVPLEVVTAKLRMLITAEEFSLVSEAGVMFQALPESYRAIYDYGWLCLSLPCSNNGYCTNTDPFNYECICPDGSTGEQCHSRSSTGIVILVLLAVLSLVIVLLVCLRQRMGMNQTGSCRAFSWLGEKDNSTDSCSTTSTCESKIDSDSQISDKSRELTSPSKPSNVTYKTRINVDWSPGMNS